MPTQAPKELHGHGAQADHSAAAASDEQCQAMRLLSMRERLASLSSEARSIRSQVPSEFKPDVERIQQQMHRLGERFSELSGAAQGYVGTADAGRPVDGADPDAAYPDPDEVIMLGGPTRPENPWDEESANALTRFYETGEAYFGSAQEAGSGRAASQASASSKMLQRDAGQDTVAVGPAWLDKRFAEVAERIERSLAEIRPQSSLLTLGRRFDQLEERMSSALEGVAMRADIEELHFAEGQIDEISGQLDQLRRQFVRLDAIDAHLETLTAQLSDERLVQLISEGAGADKERLDAIETQLGTLASQLSHERLADIVSQGSMQASDLEGLAAAAALKTAAHMADQHSNEGQIREIGEVRGILESFINEHRNSDENNASMLDTMQQAIVRVLDRIDALELAQQNTGAAAPLGAKAAQAPTAAGATGLYGQSQSPQANGDYEAPQTAPYGDDREDPPMAAPVQSKFTGGPFDLNAAFASGRETDEDRYGSAESPDALRHDFIADAHRAKLKAASKADGSGNAGQRSAEEMAFENDNRAPADTKARPRRSIFSLRSPRTLMAILTLLAAIPAALFFMPRTPTDGALIPGIENFLSFDEDVQSGTNAPDADQAVPGAQEGTGTTSPTNGVPSKRSERSGPDSRTGSGELEDVGRAEGDGYLGRVDTAALPEGVLMPANVMRDRVLQANGAAASSAETVSGAGEPLELPAPTVGPYSLRLAATQGDPSAQFEVAVRIGEGQGTAQDSKEAALWYERSANNGFAMAQYRLGTLYERGLGVAKDLEQAEVWYTRAAEQGNVKAMHNLAVLIAGYGGTDPDYATASRWFAEAAERGLADSQYNLAVLYENGLGVTQDLKEAYKWLLLAAGAGDSDAQSRRETLHSAMSAADRAEAETRARSWKAKPTDPLANDAHIAGQAWSRARQRNTRG